MFSTHTLQEHGGNWLLTLYVESEHEFAQELGQVEEEECQRKLGERVRHYIAEYLPTLMGRNLTVKIMAGAVMIGTLSVGPTEVKAQELSGKEAKAESKSESFNMGYLFYGTTKNFVNDVDNAGGVPKVVAPSFLELDQDGNLTLTWQFNASFVNEMHQRGIRVIPYLTNNWDRNLGRKALQNRALLSKQIADAMQTYNFDGVNIDIEHLTEADRDAQTDFIRLIREKVPSTKEISVAVAPNPNGWKTGWVGSYDYGGLVKYADYLFLMAYDESSEGDQLPGPVASYGFVERSIQYALAQGVPGNKLVLGLPFYGRYWKQGEAFGGFGMTDRQIQDLLGQYQSTTEYDPVSHSMKATVTIKAGDPASFIGGRTLGPGVYTIWYDNEETIGRKIGLVGKYGLKGTGEWSIGQETKNVWNVLGQQASVVTTPATPEPIETPTTPAAASRTGFQRKHPQGIGVILNGLELEFTDQHPAFVNSRTMVPLRKVFESMGAVVGYDKTTKVITITKGGVKVVLKQGSKLATVNGKQVTLDQPAIVLGGRTMVPLRFVSEALGAKVDWDQATTTAFLTTDEGATSPAPAPPQTTDQASPVFADQPASDSTAGASSAAVRELQQNLQALGYFSSPVTGMEDDATANAVRSFQRAYGLTATGVADASTQTALAHALVKRSIVSDANKYLGIPYHWGGTTPQTGFDCSGFVHYMFTTHDVTSIPRTTSNDLYKRGTAVSKANLRPGDLVYFAINQPGVISHVGIYIGNNQFISATSSKGIAVYALDNSYWGPHYIGANRVY